MEKFAPIHSHAIPLPAENIDTDQIIPARFLKLTDKAGLSDKLFHDWRYDADGTPKPDFALNQQPSQGAQILLAGANFGSGSSREHAPWALVAWGFRAVISTSFADIFRSNALKNGLLPIVVDESTHKRMLEESTANRAAKFSIDLESETLVTPWNERIAFEIDAFSKHCLLEGIDELGYLLAFQSEIEDFEQNRKQS